MKKILMVILIFIFSCICFAKSSNSSTNYKFEVVLPESDSSYVFPTEDNEFYFAGAAGLGDANSEIENIELDEDITPNPESLGDGLEKYTYNIEVQGTGIIQSSNTVKLVLNYLYPKDPNATLPSLFYESDILDAEQRFMVGEVESDKSVEERTYIEYKDIATVLTGGKLPSSKEYRLPAGEGSSVNAYPLYQYGETDSDNYDTFKNGNVITHLYDVRFTPPKEVEETTGITVVSNTETTTNTKKDVTTTTEVTTITSTETDDGSEVLKSTEVITITTIVTTADDGTTKTLQTKTISQDDPIFYTDRYYASGTTDLNSDGLGEWYEDHVVDTEEAHDPSNGKYYRGYITITKYVWFDPQNSEDATPPNSTIESMKIKSRTSGSLRQSTSSVEINAGDYDEVLTSDPNPFKITEREERGIN